MEEKHQTISRLIQQYEETRYPQILDQLVTRYNLYRQEEHVEWFEEMIDSSHLSDEIYEAINESIQL